MPENLLEVVSESFVFNLTDNCWSHVSPHFTSVKRAIPIIREGKCKTYHSQGFHQQNLKNRYGKAGHTAVFLQEQHKRLQFQILSVCSSVLYRDPVFLLLKSSPAWMRTTPVKFSLNSFSVTVLGPAAGSLRYTQFFPKTFYNKEMTKIPEHYEKGKFSFGRSSGSYL